MPDSVIHDFRPWLAQYLITNAMKNRKVDLAPFAKIAAQLSQGDKASFLTILDAHGALFGDFAYLEIGSHLGGSIAPVLLNSRCRKIYSLDKRPKSQPDDTGKKYDYPQNSTARMMENLRAVDSSASERVVCFDGDTATIPIPDFQIRPSICFVDGEHTDAVAFRDYQYCRKVIQDQGTMVFHDANTIYLTLQRIVADLAEQEVPFEAYSLADTMFLVSLGSPALSTHHDILELLLQGGGYLPSLVINDHYRRFSNKWIFRWLRRLKDLLR